MEEAEVEAVPEACQPVVMAATVAAAVTEEMARVVGMAEVTVSAPPRMARRETVWPSKLMGPARLQAAVARGSLPVAMLGSMT